MKKKFTLSFFIIICVFCHGQITQTFFYTGSVQNFTVPACVSTMTVELRGAQGGSSAFAGGNGGSVSGVISVTPGQLYNIFVGGQGSISAGGYNGGGYGGNTPAVTFGAGGGGATDITLGGSGLANRIMVAAGGGGSGGSTTYNPSPGIGGGGSFCSSPYGYGGQGGFGCSNGGDGGCSGGTAANYGTGGAGAGMTSGGAISGATITAPYNGVFGTAGILGTGGNGGNEANRNGAGGGGAGYYGGAGGMSGDGGCNGGGGGGSSYANDILFSSISFSAGNQTGHGIAIISYYLFMPPVGVVTSTNCSGSPVTLAAGAASGYTWTTGSNSQNVVVSPTVNTTYTAQSINTLGCVTSTVFQVLPQSLPAVKINSASTMVLLGNGSTTLSSGNPILFNFADPLPANARLRGTILEMDAVDQGFGGTNAGLGCYLSGDAIGNPILTHSSQHFVITTEGTFPGYIKNGTNNVSMYFLSFPGWRAFVTNASLTLVYDTGTLSTCAGNSVTLTASGAASYTWSGGLTNGVPHVPVSSVIRTVTATGSNGCFNTSTISLIVNPLPTITVAGSSTVCSGFAAPQVASGANSYSWSTGVTISTLNVSPINTITYTVTGTNTLTGCFSSLARTLTAFPIPTISVSNYNICSGNSLTLTPTGASTYTYSSGTAIVTPTSSTTYSVSGTSTAGCVSAAPAISNVTVNITPTVSVNSGSICSGSSFSIIPSGAFSYSITGGVFNVSPSSTTSYSVAGTSTAGCVSTTSAVSTVTVRPKPVITSNSGSICAGSSYTILPGGASTYTITGNNFTVSPGNTTSYSITGTSSLGCTSSNTSVVTVTVHAIPVISVNSGTMCSGKSFTIIPSGASVYSVTGNNFTVSPSTNTSYAVTGTSSAGCIGNNTAVASVTVHALPVISVNSGSICEGNSFLIIPTGAQNYSITGNVFNVSPATSTNYAVTGTSSLGCQSAAAAIANVTVHTRPLITVNSGSICAGENYTIMPGGAVNYNITGGQYTVTPATTTSYSVTGTSSVGCPSSNTAVATVTVHSLPLISVNNGTICNGQQFVIIPSGGATYSITGNSFSVSPASTSSYSVTGASQFGCISSNTAVSSVTVHALPVISVNSGSICAGSLFSIVPSGAATYSISGNIFNVSPPVTTSYSITGTSSLGCLSAAAAVAEITVHALPLISASDGTICGGGSFVISPGGAGTYSITGGTFTVSPATTTSYSITGTSTAGCVSPSSTPVNVLVNQLPVIVTKSTNSAVCLGDPVTLTASGASTYTWNNSVVNGQSFVPVTTSSYSVTGTDNNGCSSGATIAVTVFDLPVLSVSASSASCPGETATLTVSGASTYVWSTGEPAQTITVTPLIETTYTVTGTDLHGCRSSSIIIRSLTSCFASITTNTFITNVSCTDKNDATVKLESKVNYPLHQVRYEWDTLLCPGRNCPGVDSLAKGDYNILRIVTYTVNNNYVLTDSTLLTVTVLDQNGPCELILYNAITPNGDGVNDTWEIVNIDEFPNNRVTIYTRWGAPVFETKGYDNRTNAWPNKDQASHLSSSTYFYIIEPGDGRPAVKGWVELLKNE